MNWRFYKNLPILVVLYLCLKSYQRLKVSSDRLVKPAIKPATPGLQGKWFIHYTTAAPISILVISKVCKHSVNELS